LKLMVKEHNNYVDHYIILICIILCTLSWSYCRV